MNAVLLVRRRFSITQSSFVEMVAWQVPSPIKGSTHSFKCRFAFAENEVCVMRYDNEAGKGNHIHRGGSEYPYSFSSVEQLIADFLREVENYEKSSAHSQN